MIDMPHMKIMRRNNGFFLAMGRENAIFLTFGMGGIGKKLVNLNPLISIDEKKDNYQTLNLLFKMKKKRKKKERVIML